MIDIEAKAREIETAFAKQVVLLGLIGEQYEFSIVHVLRPFLRTYGDERHNAAVEASAKESERLGREYEEYAVGGAIAESIRSLKLPVQE